MWNINQHHALAIKEANGVLSYIESSDASRLKLPSLLSTYEAPPGISVQFWTPQYKSHGHNRVQQNDKGTGESLQRGKADRARTVQTRGEKAWE